MEDGTYAPAHLLADGRMERAGRVKGSTESLQAVAVQGLPESGSFAHSAAVVVVGDELLSGKVRSFTRRHCPLLAPTPTPTPTLSEQLPPLCSFHFTALHCMCC